MREFGDEASVGTGKGTGEGFGAEASKVFDAGNKGADEEVGLMRKLIRELIRELIKEFGK